MIVVLDLDGGLLDESGECRLWLVDLLRRQRVILITSRPASCRAGALERIETITGWAPQEAHFNERDLPALAWKEFVLKARLLTRFDAAKMLAIDGDPEARAMHEHNGERAVAIGDKQWARLPN